MTAWTGKGSTARKSEQIACFGSKSFCSTTSCNVFSKALPMRSSCSGVRRSIRLERSLMESFLTWSPTPPRPSSTSVTGGMPRPFARSIIVENDGSSAPRSMSLMSEDSRPEVLSSAATVIPRSDLRLRTTSA